MRKTPTFWAAAVAAAIAVPASAQEPSKDHVKELIAQALQQAGQTTPTAQPSQPAFSGPVTALTADDAVRRALERNLDIQVQRLEPQLLDLQVAALWSTYRPNLTSSLFTQGATNLPTSQLQSLGGSQVSNDTMQWNAGMQKNFRWGGGALAANFNNTPARDVATPQPRGIRPTLRTSRHSTPSPCCGTSRWTRRGRAC